MPRIHVCSRNDAPSPTLLQGVREVPVGVYELREVLARLSGLDCRAAVAQTPGQVCRRLASQIDELRPVTFAQAVRGT